MNYTLPLSLVCGSILVNYSLNRLAPAACLFLTFLQNNTEETCLKMHRTYIKKHNSTVVITT